MWLVENFKKVESRDVINRQFTTLYDEVMEQYMKELSQIHALFDAHKAKPLIYESYPPVAGAIAWARDLYHRIDLPMPLVGVVEIAPFGEHFFLQTLLSFVGRDLLAVLDVRSCLASQHREVLGGDVNAELRVADVG